MASLYARLFDASVSIAMGWQAFIAAVEQVNLLRACLEVELLKGDTLTANAGADTCACIHQQNSKALNPQAEGKADAIKGPPCGSIPCVQAAIVAVANDICQVIASKTWLCDFYAVLQLWWHSDHHTSLCCAGICAGGACAALVVWHHWSCNFCLRQHRYRPDAPVISHHATSTNFSPWLVRVRWSMISPFQSYDAIPSFSPVHAPSRILPPF